MHQKETLQQKYFQFLKIGQFIDVLNPDQQWKLAKVIDRDKRYLLVQYDGWLSKQEQIHTGSSRVAPLRTFTSGYTGPTKKVSRHYLPVQQLANYLEVGLLQLEKPSDSHPFVVNELFRGKIFVHMHNLIFREACLLEKQVPIINKLLSKYVTLCLKVLNLAFQNYKQYFEGSGWGSRLFHLSSFQISLVFSLQELLKILVLLIGAEISKDSTLFKAHNKDITTQAELWNFFQSKNGISKIQKFFKMNDQNGRWYPSQARKCAFYILLKSVASFKNPLDKLQLPSYSVKDYIEFFSIMPFVIYTKPDSHLENMYVNYTIQLLLISSPFDAKLRAIQQLKKIFEGKVVLKYLDKNHILTKILENKLVENLLDPKAFNPQVFKRFSPLLGIICKTKALSLTHIESLFKILEESHDSQTEIIFQIICEISDFAPSNLLDNIFEKIRKLELNDQQNLNLVKLFTLKAIGNLDREKSYLSSWISSRKGSSRFGYYGLNLLLKESADEGSLKKEFVIKSLIIVKQLLQDELFHSERWSVIASGIDSIKKRKNVAQSIKLISLVLSTFQKSNFLSEDQGKIIKKLQNKHELIISIMDALKLLKRKFQQEQLSKKHFQRTAFKIKFSWDETLRFFFELVAIIGNYVKNPLQIKDIEYLWLEGSLSILLEFLRKETTDAIKDGQSGFRIKKLISIQTVEDIFTTILKKESFYKRFLSCQQFQTIYELFIFYHLEKGNIFLKTKDGLIRFRTPELLGYSSLVKFIVHSPEESWFEKNLKKVCNIFLRPLNQQYKQQAFQERALIWKKTFSIFVSQLAGQPWKLLKFIKIFYQAAKGRFKKDIMTSNKNLQFGILWGQLRKTVSISPRSTIFHLRQIIKQMFCIEQDFDMFNVKLKKVISFQQEEDFSVNAMPIMQSTKQASLTISCKKGIHPHEITFRYFTNLVGQDEQIYNILFALLKGPLDKQLQQQFWEVVQLLPLNKIICKQIADCKRFTQQKWQKYFGKKFDHAMLYRLKIVLDLIKNCPDWASSFLQTRGMNFLIQIFLVRIQVWNFTFQDLTFSIKLLQVVLSVLDKCKANINSSKIMEIFQQKLLLSLQNTLVMLYSDKTQIQSMQNSQKSQQFHEQPIWEQINPNKQYLPLVNKVLQTYLYLTKIMFQSRQGKNIQRKEQQQKMYTQSEQKIKIYSRQNEHQSIEKAHNQKELRQNTKNPNRPTFRTLQLLLEVGLFETKGQQSRKFSQQILISLTFTVYQDLPSRLKILQMLVKKLDIENLESRKRCDQFFKYLITILYSLEKELADKSNLNKKQFKNDKFIQEQGSCEFKKPSIDGDNQVQQSNRIDSNNYNENLQESVNQSITNCLSTIKEFIQSVLENPQIKDHQEKTGQILNGSLTLLKFLIYNKSVFTPLDLPDLIDSLLNYLLLPTNPLFFRRILSDKNSKTFFEILKRIAFEHNQIILSMISKLRPHLIKNQYRRNESAYWRLQLRKDQKKLFVGLQNLGATCYINCLFQQLFMIKPFRQGFMSVKFNTSTLLEQHQETYELQKLFYQLQFSDKKSVSTQIFCQKFITLEGESINPLVQSDADEFLNTLLDKIQFFLRKTGQHQILQETFEGKLSNQLICQDCPHSSQKVESFLSIGVSIKGKKNLNQALTGYVSGEILDGENAYYCENCEKKVRTIKRMCLKQLPNILVIVLKRFEYDFDDYRKVKMNGRLQFPQTLDLSPYTREKIDCCQIRYEENKSEESLKNMFELRGTVIHAGNADAGHYYSFIKQEKKWYEFNDEAVGQISWEKVQNQGFGGQEQSSDDIKIQKFRNAYILFYEKIQPTYPSRQKIKIEKQLQGKQTFDSQIWQIQSGMRQDVLADNLQSNIFTTILEPNFIRLWQNFSILENTEVKKFFLIYFHTAILRSYFRYEYAPNLYRIAAKILLQDVLIDENKQINFGEWFVNQINSLYIKQFLVEAPQTVRYICTSLVLMALRRVPSLDQQQILCFVSMLKNNSMTPYAKILRQIASRQKNLIFLRQIKFQQVVLSVINQLPTFQEKLPIPIWEVRSYFGTQCSTEKIEKQKCSATLLQTLENFDLDFETLENLNSSFSYHRSNRIINFKISKYLLDSLAKNQKTTTSLEQYLTKTSQRREKLSVMRHYNEKYKFLIRGLINYLQKDENYYLDIKQKVTEVVVNSIGAFFERNTDLLEPNQLLIGQITHLTKNYVRFNTKWSQHLQKSNRLKDIIKNWLRELSKGSLTCTWDQNNLKLKNCSTSEKYDFWRSKQKSLEKNSQWLKSFTQAPIYTNIVGLNGLNPQTKNSIKQQNDNTVCSDSEEVKEGQILSYGNKVFRIRQKIPGSLICSGSLVDKGAQEYWIVFDKSQIQLFSNL